MKTRYTIAALISALATAGLGSTALILLFGDFGMDITTRRVGDIYDTPNGGMIFWFDAGDNQVGRWIRELPPDYGAGEGRIWLDTVPFDYPGNGSAAVITGTPPFTARVQVQAAGQEAGSGTLYVECTTIPQPETMPSHLGGAIPDTFTRYDVVLMDSLSIRQETVLRSDGPSTFAVPPGTWRLYFARLDTLDLRGPWIGPVEIRTGAQQ